MAARKRSISLDAGVARAVERAAEEEGMSVSAWLSRAASHRLRVERGLLGVAAWEAEAGALTRAELAAGELLLERLLSGKNRSPGVRADRGSATATRRRKVA